MDSWKARPDGWPLCPKCDEDELWCPTSASPRVLTQEEPLAEWLKHELRCYRCSTVYPGGAFLGGKWGEFEMENGEHHVAPVAYDGSTDHELDGIDCWCRPRRNEDHPSVITHEAPN